jgi:NADP-dependent aldehyde dehydrogenase
MRLFSTLVADGSWVNARIDLGDPDRRPTPKPDLRRMLTAIGPVAVFGASNFPFAYSVAGGDTASALAAGCPVIVKAHPAHPGTSEMTALAIEKAAIAVDMPEGIFSMLHGGNRVGIALIRHPGLAAAGFTGSLQGGRALMIAAASRSAPIPVHAEMGSTNPVILLPEALEIHWDSIAENLALSVTNGVGQFCTNPGLIIAVASPSLNRFKEKLASLISEVTPGVMLTADIKGRYSLGLEWWTQNGAEAIVSADRTEAKGARSNTAFFETTAKLFVTKHKLSDEVFGPATLLIVCSDRSELFDIARALTGQLTASIHGEPDELVRYADLINIVTARVGRLIYNGFPTGVEVNPSMTHGGPFPATSDSRFTSVGTAAIYRFARPVTWQNAPDPQLPLELQNSNPLNVRRLVDGEFTSSKIE